MAAAIAEHAPAKINLFLHITGRRADGYHLLDSLAVFTRAGDTVTATTAGDLSLHLEGSFGAALTAEPDNLVLRAARALAREAGIPAQARLTLRKELPIASGIGGGSADAAAALRALIRLWNLRPEADALAALALRLGADVPVCIASEAARMGGIGEVLTAAPRLPDCGIVLVNPGVSVSTPEVFRARQGGGSPPADLPAAWDTSAAMAAHLGRFTNDLAAAAITLRPQIADVLAALNALPGCLLARMSGSGATCFGLFASPEAAERAASGVNTPGWWRWGGGLFPG